MGCDIHAYAERKVGDKYEAIRDVSPFDYRNYGLYGWLADVRNYSAVTPIAAKRGLPDDMSADVREEYELWEMDAHSASWLALSELLAFDYDQQMEDRRVTRQVGPNAWSGAITCDPGEGEKTTYREFFGGRFFDDLEKLKASGADRVVFWFDN